MMESAYHSCAWMHGVSLPRRMQCGSGGTSQQLYATMSSCPAVAADSAKPGDLGAQT